MTTEQPAERTFTFRMTLRGLIVWVLMAAGCGPAVGGGQGSSGGQSGGGSSSASSTSTSASTTFADSSSSGPQTTTSSSTGPDAPPPGCTCDPSGVCGGESVLCAQKELCPVLQTDCARPEVFYGCIGQEVLLDEATLTCALDALIARTPGSFDILLLSERISSCGLEGCTYNRWRVQILGEDAVVSQCLVEPMTDSPSTDILRALETPEFFAACKEERTTGARLDCLFEGLRPGTVLTCR